MSKSSASLLISLVSLAVLVGACKPKTDSEMAAPPRAAYFKTSFQEESQFIVESIVSDLAQEMYYAAHQRLPDRKEFHVAAKEKSGSPLDAPVYELQIRLDAKQPELTTEANITGPIWSPAVYQTVATRLAEAVGLSPGQPGAQVGTTLLPNLSDATAETIEREDQALSSALEKDFRNAESHEKAAALLGAFLMRDHSGHFFDLRTPLSRVTAHLAMAQFLRAGRPYGINGQMAEAMVLTLVNAETPALERLDAIQTNNAESAILVRALRAHVTGDFRRLIEVKDPSRIERVEWFSTKADYAGTPTAWLNLTDAEKQTVDFVRAANQEQYSVEVGHELLRAALPLEMGEINTVYELSHREKLKPKALVQALNELPTGCFSDDPAGQTHVQVIGWGQWALFLQRHLCHAIQQNYYFMASMWGVPDDAKQFAAQSEASLAGLRLYPFVRRFTCSTLEDYHKSVDDGFKVTVATPQLVPAECWNYLCYKVRFAPLYTPNPNPHVNEWHHHNPPPGTVYDLNPRLHHPSLTDSPEVVARFEKLHELAPYDCRICNFIVAKKYNDHPTYDQAMALYGPVLPYSVLAMRRVAGTVYDQPEQYEKLLRQAGELDPACYYDLGDYFIGRNQEDKGAQYVDKACDADPDTVRASTHAIWRVRHDLRKGETAKARKIADEAAEVYSFYGLEAKAIFLEAISDYDGAFDWFFKIEERYNNSAPLLAFCLRYEGQTGDLRYAPEVKKRLGKLFPKGIENVSLSNFHVRPTDGVLIRQQNELLQAAGLKEGDVIVAVYGMRVHNFMQYLYGRDSKQTPELDLIVWQGDAYREFKPSPPKHRFGVEFDDYAPQKAANRTAP